MRINREKLNKHLSVVLTKKSMVVKPEIGGYMSNVKTVKIEDSSRLHFNTKLNGKVHQISIDDKIVEIKDMVSITFEFKVK